MTQFLIGFVVALAVGSTGIGGGSFTVPALVLLAGLPAQESVGTAFVFAGALRLIVAPFYFLGEKVHLRYLWLLLEGAIPGLLIGTYALRLLSHKASSPVVVVLLGLLLASSSGVTFAPWVHNRGFARKNNHLLAWLGFPIGVEAGFSSAGAGALGTVFLLNYSELNPQQVVGTNVFFGLVLAIVGSAFQWMFGSIDGSVLLRLLAGGVPGVLLGYALARQLPAQKLKTAVAILAMFAGLQLVWNGMHSLLANRATRVGTPAETTTHRAGISLTKAVSVQIGFAAN